MDSAALILSRNQLRLTAIREEIIALFLAQEIALSEPEIERSITASCDRVTIYRTLNTFLDKGIVHKVLDDTGAMKYALCRSGCSQAAHSHNHVHFKCELCGQTQCLDQIGFHTPVLPEGFLARETNVLIQGMCQQCSLANPVSSSPG